MNGLENTALQQFTNAWLAAMLGFQSGSLTLEQADDLVETFSDTIDEEISDFACNVLSEIGGAPGTYAKTISI